jgi:hypothetical protein
MQLDFCFSWPEPLPLLLSLFLYFFLFRKDRPKTRLQKKNHLLTAGKILKET